jgi:hypothetical protein
MSVQLDNCVKFFSKIILNELSEVCMTWIGGGCVRDYFSVGKLTSDIDLYFPDEAEFNKCKEYLMKATMRTVKENIDDEEVIKEVPKPKAVKLFENDTVLKVKYNNRLYDVIKRYFPSPDLTITEFDFTVCCAAVDRRQIYTHNTFFIDLAKRQLMINKLPFPLSTLWRMQKYIQKGYYMCSGEMLKLAKAIGSLQVNTEEGESKAIELQPMSEGGDPKFLTFD